MCKNWAQSFLLEERFLPLLLRLLDPPIWSLHVAHLLSHLNTRLNITQPQISDRPVQHLEVDQFQAPAFLPQPAAPWPGEEQRRLLRPVIFVQRNALPDHLGLVQLDIVAASLLLLLLRRVRLLVHPELAAQIVPADVPLPQDRKTLAWF